MTCTVACSGRENTSSSTPTGERLYWKSGARAPLLYLFIIIIIVAFSIALKVYIFFFNHCSSPAPNWSSRQLLRSHQRSIIYGVLIHYRTIYHLLIWFRVTDNIIALETASGRFSSRSCNKMPPTLFRSPHFRRSLLCCIQSQVKWMVLAN